MLLYTSKGVTATNQFKVHGQLPLHGMIVSIVIHCLLLALFLSLHWTIKRHHGWLVCWKRFKNVELLLHRHDGSGSVCLWKKTLLSGVAGNALDY